LVLIKTQDGRRGGCGKGRQDRIVVIAGLRVYKKKKVKGKRKK
jgi:hypothetical protein